MGRQLFSKDAVHDMERAREWFSYTNIPGITGKLEQMFPPSNFPSFSSFCVWLCRSLSFLRLLLYEGPTLKCQVSFLQKTTARNEALNARFIARQVSWESLGIPPLFLIRFLSAVWEPNSQLPEGFHLNENQTWRSSKVSNHIYCLC